MAALLGVPRRDRCGNQLLQAKVMRALSHILACVAACALAGAALAQSPYVYGKADTLKRFSYERQPELIETNCIAWYTFEVDDGGAIFYDYSTTVNDALQTNANARPTWSAGKYDFDGTDDRIDAPRNVISNDTTYTVMCWATMDSVTGNSTPFDSTTATGSISILWRIIVLGSSSNIEFSVRDSAANKAAVLLDGSSLLSGSHHLAMSRNGTNLEAYIDGASVGTDDAPFGAHAPSHYTTIGAVRNETGAPTVSSFHDGTVNDTRVYDRALSDAEISNIWVRTSGAQ
ncbi:MAG: LamG domain-containing protein [bacterium]|nr:LamG domain-containing protein [bacterium]